MLCALTLAAVPLAGQGSGRDTLPPRAYWRLATHAKVVDSIASQRAAWRAWAADAPTVAAPRLALAMLSRLDYRYAEAFAWLDSASRVAGSTPVWRAAVARERIGALLSRGEFSGTDTLLALVLADSAGVTRDEWAESRFIEVARRRRTEGRVDLADIERVAAIAAPTDSILHARLSCLRAVADRPRMLEHAERGIALADAAGVPSISANCQLVVGSLLRDQGDIAGALRWLGRAEQTARASHDESTLAATLQWRGYTLSNTGSIQAARRALAEGIRIASRIEERNTEAWALLSVSGTARLVGDAVTMSSALRRAAILFDATGDAVGAQNQRLEQAQALLMLNDLAGAERIGRQSLAFGDSLHDDGLALRSLYTLSDVAVRSGRLAEAQTLLDSADVYVTRLGEAWRTQLTEYRGVLALRSGRNAEAIRLLSTARSGWTRGQDLFRYIVDGSLALSWMNSGDSARAAQTLLQANVELDGVRDAMASSGQRKVLSSPDMWGGTSSHVDQVLAGFVTSPRWLPTVFAVTERVRARALIKGAFGSESLDSAAANAARERVRATALVLGDVQRTMRPNTAFLVYAGGTARARTSLMVITRTGAKGLTLAPLDSLDRDIVRWLALMESGERGTGAGQRVAASVLGSALRGLPANITRIVVIPQGPLYRVPFHALPVGAGVLGDRAIVTVAPSVSLALSYAVDARPMPARVLALGAGDTEVASATPDLYDIGNERSQRGNPLAPLVAAADEARAAAGWAPGSQVLTGAEASESALKRESRGAYTVLHTAAHALTSDQALGANWLILRPDSTDDGYVSGGELAELSIGRSMVVLSGCRTTGDFGSHGDAIDGLVAPLLARGVRTVVASHWAVSDRWTKVLMERFYQYLARGATTADAMNMAQTSLRRSGVPARFWAAFSVIGDGSLTFATAPTGR